MAYLLQSGGALLIDTAGLQAALGGTVVVALALEAAEKRRLHLEAARQRTEALERLADMARHDPLTGAVTRYEFMARIDERVQSGQAAWVVAYSLPRFDRISEAMGYRIADLVLKEVVERSRRAGAVAGRPDGRLGLCGDAACGDRCGGARGVLRQVAAAAAGGLHPRRPPGGRGLDHRRRILGRPRHQGRRRYDPAQPGRNGAQVRRMAAGHQVVHYKPAMEERIASARTLELALKEAVERKEIQVHYQGQFDLQTGALVGAEALARWTHPELGPVSPARFVALAEETGLTVALGASVMRKACMEAARWAAMPAGGQRVAHAVRARRRGRPRLAVPQGERPAASRLDIEITEGLLLKATPAVLRALEGYTGWASASRSTISAPATRRWATWARCRSTS